VIAITMFDANDFVTSVVVDKQTYKLHFGWNSNAEQWNMDVRNADNSDIVRGVAVVPNFPLLHQGRRNGLPSFEIMAVVVNTASADNQKIGRKDFVDGKFSLVIVPRSEVNAIKAAALE